MRIGRFVDMVRRLFILKFFIFEGLMSRFISYSNWYYLLLLLEKFRIVNWFKLIFFLSMVFFIVLVLLFDFIISIS